MSSFVVVWKTLYAHWQRVLCLLLLSMSIVILAGCMPGSTNDVWDQDDTSWVPSTDMVDDINTGDDDTADANDRSWSYWVTTNDDGSLDVGRSWDQDDLDNDDHDDSADASSDTDDVDDEIAEILQLLEALAQ